jgi:hypothetical protein
MKMYLLLEWNVLQLYDECAVAVCLLTKDVDNEVTDFMELNYS